MQHKDDWTSLKTSCLWSSSVIYSTISLQGVLVIYCMKLQIFWVRFSFGTTFPPSVTPSIFLRILLHQFAVVTDTLQHWKWLRRLDVWLRVSNVDVHVKSRADPSNTGLSSQPWLVREVFGGMSVRRTCGPSGRGNTLGRLCFRWQQPVFVDWISHPIQFGQLIFCKLVRNPQFPTCFSVF